MKYRNKYATTSVKFNPKVKLIFSMNEMPVLSESTRGALRRFSFIEFKNTLEDKEMDINIGHKLKDEQIGIFNILLSYYKKYQKEGLGELPSNILHDAVYVGDTKLAWLKDCLEITGNYDHTVDSETCWKSFLDYSYKQGQELGVQLSQRKLFLWLRKRSELRDYKEV